MGRVVGVACDNCGSLDVELFSYHEEFKYSEDSFPRNGWISLNQWNSVEDKMRYAEPGEELHICSSKCLKEFGEKYYSANLEEETENDKEKYGHTHD